jgi:hypothetical protein
MYCVRLFNEDRTRTKLTGNPKAARDMGLATARTLLVILTALLPPLAGLLALLVGTLSATTLLPAMTALVLILLLVALVLLSALIGICH